jgi:hypothetical protein
MQVMAVHTEGHIRSTGEIGVSVRERSRLHELAMSAVDDVKFTVGSLPVASRNVDFIESNQTEIKAALGRRY